ncbi:MAG: protein kinase family protein, partial [Actinobacteria bacterium]|nr:protein kinase family protein [Actinomycetota bacterium]
MQGVGPGTIIGGRYSLRHRLTKGSDLERWSAHDTTLERDVALTILDSVHPNRAAILDAARRAAGVEDTRLVRILDVGTQAGSSYIVEEALSEAESLATILLQGALPAEEARRIAGETASALETARQRGLHHLRLTPLCVMRTSDGAIKVSGVAVAAAINGTEEPDPAAASRRDAVAVVAVTYAALTSRWPLNEQVLGIEPAPRVVSGVAAPSEIAAGVPGDLDALCRMTLNEDTGPLTPGDFASQIAPWSRATVHRAGVDPTVVLTRPQPGSESPEATTATTATTAGEKAAAAGAAATKVVGTALAGAGTAAGVVGGKVGSFARAATDKAAARAARADTDLGGEQMTLGEALSTPPEDAEPPLPMLPASTAQTPSRDQSKIVVTIVATFVAFSLLVAYCGSRNLGQSSQPNTAAGRTVTVTAPPVTVGPSNPAATQVGPAVGQPIAILSATGFDPQGDKNEKNSQAPRVYDGNLATAWTSEGYNSANFGGLPKKGVGVLLDLGQPTSVSQVTIDLGLGPVDVTTYAATVALSTGPPSSGPPRQPADGSSSRPPAQCPRRSTSSSGSPSWPPTAAGSAPRSRRSRSTECALMSRLDDLLELPDRD